MDESFTSLTRKRRTIHYKTRCARCPVSVVKDINTGDYMHVDEEWRSEKLHGHYAEARYETNHGPKLVEHRR